MKKNIFIILILANFLYSCDPMDDRMIFKNNSTKNIFTRMLFINEDIRGVTGSIKINSNSENRIGKIVKWEFEFEDSRDSLLSVIIFKDYKFLNDKWERSNNIKSDSLLKIGDYEVHHYNYEYLEENNWQINYPDDGFEKGKPLDIIRENNSSKKPNPKK
ncbi:hypothetical protein [Aureivirga sp. CE67]|uniref:hypothetical protein n=1 Tax=Aureivirga sp. CE67 TaxID=1788983 RepID=UPI0018C9AD93|nr:hypothetical protein [Aureivirga sp. CE67]